MAKVHAASWLEGTPHVHVHHLTTDAEMDAAGEGVTELCCHGCGEALLLHYPATIEAELEGDAGVPRLRRIRDAFQREHAHCVMPGMGPEAGKRLCPSYRRVVRTIRLAEAVSE